LDIGDRPRGTDQASEPVHTDRTTPDVTVVVAVYNTMPYLTGCLESVFGQTIGVDRLEVVAVDDGSTDGSGAELDRWAVRYPQSMTVLRQPNSGGPAGPSNRALDAATGRYVFFLGADDHLGLEALERLVDAADELDADIMLGRLVGTEGRNVNQAVFAGGNRDDIDLNNSALPWALSNTKLFRRSMIEENGIRYPEELRSGSDQPFTIRAVVAARRIAVRADYEFYYATRRKDSSNITYRTSLADFVRDAALIMAVAADAIPDPRALERVLCRHFTWELGKLLGARLLAASREEQCQVQEGVRKLAEAYLSDTIRASLDVQHRVSLSVAQHGTVDDVITVALHRGEHRLSPIVADGGRYYVAYPGFRDSTRAFPDAWYECTAQMLRREHQTEPAQVSWGRSAAGKRALLVTWRMSLPDLGLDGVDAPWVMQVGDGLAVSTESRHDDRDGRLVLARVVLDDLVAEVTKVRSRRVRYACKAHGVERNCKVVADVSGIERRLHRRDSRLYWVLPTVDDAGWLRLKVQPVSVRRLARRLLRKVSLTR
jgi:glycosyltransferase involved in cell wall biosynthesis